MFLPLLLHFWNYNLSTNRQIMSFNGTQAHPQTQPLRSDIFIVEYLQPNKFKKSQASTLYIRLPVFLSWTKHHFSMYFLGKAVFQFLRDEKRSCFRRKNTIFPDNTRKIKCRHRPFWKDHLFRRSEENVIFSYIF